MPARIVSCEASFLRLQIATLLCSHRVFLLFSCEEKEIYTVSFSSYKDASPVRLGHHLYDLITLITFLKTLKPNTVTYD
jgi:hypothetical protein